MEAQGSLTEVLLLLLLWLLDLLDRLLFECRLDWTGPMLE